ncbi:MAG TPA: hypothetical protein VFN30_06570 [Chitinophagaceae bacterium]|nr:hypothetical protein [Chitinophagaceae bacterium]
MFLLKINRTVKKKRLKGSFAKKKSMKSLIIFPVLILSVLALKAQPADSVKAPYLLDKKLPFFKIMLTDSSFFYKDNLKKNRATIIILFSPECDHCKKQIEQLIQNIDKFKKTQILMISPLPFTKIKEFYNEYQIHRYKNIKMGKDALYFFANYFQTHYIPFIAAYDKNKQLIKGWEGNVNTDDLIKAVNQP